jgi:peroxiredoxin
MPTLVRAAETYRADGLEIVAFNVTYQDSLPEARAFVDEFQLPFPVVLDEAGHVTADDYQLRGLPMSIFINRDGVITRVQLGAMSETQIEEFIEALLAEP